jgi:hypothetical protein
MAEWKGFFYQNPAVWATDDDPAPEVAAEPETETPEPAEPADVPEPETSPAPTGTPVTDKKE